MWNGRTLLLLNSHADTIELLTDWFRALGAIVLHARTRDLCGDMVEARQFVASSRPDVILFDLGIPYDVNWQCFQRLRRGGVFGGTPVVVTTVNARALQQVVGRAEAFEIIGTPHDLSRLQDFIEWRLAGHRREPSSSRH